MRWEIRMQVTLQFLVANIIMKYSIIGRPSINVFWLYWRQVFRDALPRSVANTITEVTPKPSDFQVKLQEEYAVVFDSDVQIPIQNYKVILKLALNATPVFRKLYIL